MAKGAQHQELTSIPFHEGNYRFCLDRVVRGDEDGRVEYAFVWRGNKRSPNGFTPKPAYFDFTLLGRVLRQSLAEGKIPSEDAKDFLAALVGLE